MAALPGPDGWGMFVAAASVRGPDCTRRRWCGWDRQSGGPSSRFSRTGTAATTGSCKPPASVPDELIPEHRCWELLATVSVGRLALSVRALPVILPVQYYLDGRRLAICLGHHQIPERSLNDVIIAFAADEIDPVTRWGWSVQVQGRSVIPLRLGVDTACGRPTAGQIVQMEPGIISGHRTHLCPFIAANT